MGVGSFTWSVTFHHDTHFHPVLLATPGVAGAEFTVPTMGETSANVWYRIALQVEDSGGRVGVAFADVHPEVGTLTLASVPSGLGSIWTASRASRRRSSRAWSGCRARSARRRPRRSAVRATPSMAGHRVVVRAPRHRLPRRQHQHDGAVRRTPDDDHDHVHHLHHDDRDHLDDHHLHHDFDRRDVDDHDRDHDDHHVDDEHHVDAEHTSTTTTSATATSSTTTYRHDGDHHDHLVTAEHHLVDRHQHDHLVDHDEHSPAALRRTVRRRRSLHQQLVCRQHVRARPPRRAGVGQLRVRAPAAIGLCADGPAIRRPTPSGRDVHRPRPCVGRRATGGASPPARPIAEAVADRRAPRGTRRPTRPAGASLCRRAARRGRRRPRPDPRGAPGHRAGAPVRARIRRLTEAASIDFASPGHERLRVSLDGV